MVRTKICGVTRRKDMDAAVEAGADAVGFVTEVPVDTDRSLEREEARELVEHAPPYISTTLVIMPETVDDAVELARHVEPDVIQIHREFDGVKKVKERCSRKVVAKKDPGDAVSSAAEEADALLVDTPGEKGAGGTGETHDWNKTREVVRETDIPVVLAGGLTPRNVGKAVREVDPYGVDVSSGVERKEGVKNHREIENFVAEARKAESSNNSEEV